MRLTPLPLEISREEGFSFDKDIFKRKAFGERLANLFENTQDNIVVALDAQWGEGKSTFVKMWQGHVENHRENKLKTIYFDAFENDYQKDPFLALSSEIYALLPDDNFKRDEFKQKAGNAFKSIARGALKIGVRSITGGILDGSIVDSVEKDISSLVADQIDTIIADRLKNSLEDKSALTVFRNYLQEIAVNEGEGNPIIFIIDELDRCRPDFALELIEQIKHIFSVKGITFLLVLNRKQLEASVKARYGDDVDASLYLQKFINIWLSLPRVNDPYDDHSEKYLSMTLRSMLNEDEQFQNNYLETYLIDIVKYKRPSYREIERILSYIAIIHNMSGDVKFYEHYQACIAFVCYLKASMPIIFERISTNSINFNDLLKECQLEINEEILQELNALDYMISVIKFDLSDENIRKQMIENKEIGIYGSQRNSRHMLLKIAKMLQTLEYK